MHMQDDFPLLLSTLYDRAVWIHPDQELVSVESDLSQTRWTYSQLDGRIRRLASAFENLGIEQGDAVATFAWNNQSHHELYWATANTGRICHTINLRLFADQIVYIVNHAGDKALFVDPDLVPLSPRWSTGSRPWRRSWVMGEEDSDAFPGSIAYEDLIADQPAWRVAPPRRAFPDDVLLHVGHHRQSERGGLHPAVDLPAHDFEPGQLLDRAVGQRLAGGPHVPRLCVGVSVHGHGQGGQADLSGSRPVAGGPGQAIRRREVTFSAGVPTVWLGIKQYLDAHPEVDVSSIRAFLCGGAAVPRSMIEWLLGRPGHPGGPGLGDDRDQPGGFDGLPEAPHGGVGSRGPARPAGDGRNPDPGAPGEDRRRGGRGAPPRWEAFGELLIRGPWIAAEYYKDDRTTQSFEDGWLRTGDVCKITPEGYIRITDRAKDVIKSGGEWISSLDVENELMSHPAVAEATVVGLKHPKWQERPAAFVVLAEGAEATPDELRGHLSERVAKWWLPDEIVFVDEIPKTGTGKFDKKVVRDQYADLLMEG
jgi:fatty-acyl-CoA synthase